MAWTLDHVGPMCKTVEDAALMLGVIAGYDELDPTSADVPVADYSRAMKTVASKLRLGVPRSPFFENLDPEVAKTLEAAIDVLRKLTASTKEVQIPAAGNIADVWNAEIYAYHTPWITKTPELYQQATRTLIQRAGQDKGAAYAEARRHVDTVRRDIRKVFNDVDLLITPTQKGPAPLITPPPGAGAGAPGVLNNTATFDIYGLPTISIPCGFTTAGLPIGLQISGNVSETSDCFDIKSLLDQTPSPSARAQLRCEGTIRRKNYGSIIMLSSRADANSTSSQRIARTFEG